MPSGVPGALMAALPLLAGAAVMQLGPAGAAPSASPSAASPAGASPVPAAAAGPAATTSAAPEPRRAGPAPLREADTTAVLAGRVLLADGLAPAAGARVEVVGQGRTVLTDSLGRFRLEGLEPGRDTLRVSTLEGREATRPVTLEPGGETTVEVALEPRVVDLGGLEVTVEGPGRSRLRRLADRIDDGVGEYITRDRLEKEKGRLTRAFRHVIGAHVAYAGRGDFRVVMRRRVGRGYCRPEMYVDGRPRPGVPVDAYHPEDMAVIEVYPADLVPGEYRTPESMECGAVILWTKAFVERG